VKARGRFDLVLLSDDEKGYIRFTSAKQKSLSRAEVIARVREFFDRLESARTVAAVDPHLQSEGTPSTREKGIR
jgi:hypothetical protein